LEDEPILNAGTGSYLQADGVARMDASIAASDGRAGAVAQVPGIRNPVRLARYLLDQEAHVMLCGPEALQLALKLGHEAAVVATPAKIAFWQAHLGDVHRRLDYAGMAEEWKRENPRLGTVGCVALDGAGRPRRGHVHGRDGAVLSRPRRRHPIIGAGTYCTPNAGVSMTGVGERIMVLLTAKRVCDLVADGRRSTPRRDAPWTRSRRSPEGRGSSRSTARAPSWSCATHRSWRPQGGAIEPVAHGEGDLLNVAEGLQVLESLRGQGVAHTRPRRTSATTPRRP
jgi:beta-aspartyl-peptidase (threonine type)